MREQTKKISEIILQENNLFNVRRDADINEIRNACRRVFLLYRKIFNESFLVEALMDHGGLQGEFSRKKILYGV